MPEAASLLSSKRPAITRELEDFEAWCGIRAEIFVSKCVKGKGKV